MGVHMPSSAMPIEASKKGGSLPSTAACPGAAAAFRRPCHNCKTASNIRKRWRAHGNDVSAHMHPDVSCALPDQHRPSPLRVQSPPPGSRLERHVVRGRMQWPSARGSCGPAPGCRGSGRPATTSMDRPRSLSAFQRPRCTLLSGAERRGGLVARIDVDEHGALGFQRDRQLERAIAARVSGCPLRRPSGHRAPGRTRARGSGTRSRYG